jgi:endogenous inhibitor of DNA gyrase (YacG/DUF329 family)
MPRCPVCDAAVDLPSAEHPPFCGERCRLIDLGRWLDEAYAVPEKPRDEDDEEAGEPRAGAMEDDEG